MALQFLNNGYFAGTVGIGTDSPDGNLEVITSTIVSGASDTVNNVLIGLQAANRPTIILDTADTTYTNRSWNITNVGSAGKLFIGRNGLDVMVMDNTGNVGIGTDSPGYKLHVVSSVPEAACFDTTSSSYGAMNVFKAQGVIKGNAGYNSGSMYFGGETGTNTIIQSGGQVGIFINNSTQNVGIGTTLPDTRLTVEGTSGHISANIRCEDGYNASIGFSDASGNWYESYIRYHTDVNDMSFAVNGSERMRIDSSGNVGIGTSSINRSGLGIDHTVVTIGTNTGMGMLELQGTRTSDADLGRIAWLNAGTRLSEIVASRIDNNTSTKMSFRTSDTGSLSTKMTILPNGNVGIGTTSPTQGKVDILDAGAYSAHTGHGLTINSNASNAYTSMYMGADDTIDAAYIQSAGRNTSFTTKKLLLQPNGGNVGIGTGTNTLIAQLHVKAAQGNMGAYFFTNHNSAVSDGHVYINSDQVLAPFTALKVRQAGTGPILQLTGTAAVGEALRVTSGGRVGIGTTLPESLLHIKGETRAYISFQDTTDGYFGFVGDATNMLTSGTVDNLGLRGEAGIQFGVSDVIKMVLNSSGNLGIGTTSPDYELQVGDGTATETINIKASSTNPSRIFFSDNDAIAQGRIHYEHGGDYMNFWTDNTERMRIDSSGLTTIKRTGITGVAKADMILQIGYEGNNGQNNLIGFGYNAASNIPAYIGYTTTSGGGSTKGDLVFATRSVTTNTAPTERMRIDSSGNATFSGKIIAGVGASAQATINAFSTTVSTNLYSALRIIENTGASSYWDIGATNGASTILNFYHNGTTTPKITFTHLGGATFAGNVGIGATSPASRLEIAMNDAAGNRLGFTGDGSTSGSALWTNWTTGASYLDFRLGGTTDTYTKMRITSAGELQVTGNGVIKNEHSSANYSYWQQTGSDARLFTQYAQPLYFGTNASTKMTILSGGNVGIGVTGPATKLEVSSSLTSGIKVTNSGTINGEAGIEAYHTGAQAGTAYAGYITKTGAGGTNVGIYTAASGATNNYGLIVGSGNVGIGTGSPSYKLDVDGTIRATGDVIAYSDVRVKENIKTIDNSLEKVSKLRGVEFNKIGEDEKSIGVIAQEIEKVIPEVVREDEKGMKSVAYGNISGLLIEAIKELKAEIEELKKCKCNCNE